MIYSGLLDSPIIIRNVTTIVATNKNGLYDMMSLVIAREEWKVAVTPCLREGRRPYLYLHKTIDPDRTPGWYPTRIVLFTPVLLGCSGHKDVINALCRSYSVKELIVGLGIAKAL